jgi:dipeptidyl aminopeptidase/acylaminoacyl peptidase
MRFPLARHVPARRAVVTAAALLLAAWPSAAAARRPDPVLAADSAAVTATAGFDWPLWIALRNPADVAFSPDSLTLIVDDLAPGETRAARQSTIVLDALVAPLGPVPAGGETGFQVVPQAVSDEARIRLRLAGRFADGERRVVTAEYRGLPGAFSRAHPSRTLTVRGRRVEVVFVPTARDSGPAPGVLFVHGHGADARRMLRVAAILSERGFATLLMSMPGYGTSEGPAELMGPQSVAAADAALAHLAQQPGVDPRRLAAWGMSRGATVVTRLAERGADLRAVVAQAGVYDLWAVHRGTALAGFPQVIQAEAGGDSAAWAERSPIVHAGSFHSALLLLHGEKDEQVPVAQARAFAEAVRAAGAPVETRYWPNSTHLLPRAEVFRTVLDFLSRRLAP